MSARILLAAGGTGGHLFPAEALAKELEQMEFEVHLVTDKRGHRVGQKKDRLHRHVVCAGGIAGKNGWDRAKNFLLLGLGFLQSLVLNISLRPKVAVGFGGYPSLAPLLAAKITGAKIVLHEQNAQGGRANRFLMRYADHIASGFPQTQGLGQKIVVTGNPVRPQIRALKDQTYTPPGSDIHLLVTGGSQGARVFSDLIPQSMGLLDDALRQRIFISQQVRKEDIDRVAGYYHSIGQRADLAPFFEDMPKRLENAHLVIARAGASTLCELTLAGRPAILVPLPNSIDGHQDANADSLAKRGAAIVFKEKGLSAQILADSLTRLFLHPQQLLEMASSARQLAKPEAARELAKLVSRAIGIEKEANDARLAS